MDSSLTKYGGAVGLLVMLEDAARAMREVMGGAVVSGVGASGVVGNVGGDVVPVSGSVVDDVAVGTDGGVTVGGSSGVERRRSDVDAGIDCVVGAEDSGSSHGSWADEMNSYELAKATQSDSEASENSAPPAFVWFEDPRVPKVIPDVRVPGVVVPGSGAKKTPIAVPKIGGAAVPVATTSVVGVEVSALSVTAGTNAVAFFSTCVNTPTVRAFVALMKATGVAVPKRARMDLAIALYFAAAMPVGFKDGKGRLRALAIVGDAALASVATAGVVQAQGTLLETQAAKNMLTDVNMCAWAVNREFAKYVTCGGVEFSGKSAATAVEAVAGVLYVHTSAFNVVKYYRWLRR